MAVNYDNLLQAAIDGFNDELDYSFWVNHTEKVIAPFFLEQT